MYIYKCFRIALLTLVIGIGINAFDGSKAYAFSGSGSGTVADPYNITTPQQFDEIRNDLGACYQLANDIDLSAYQSGEGWVPIGDWDNSFTGSLDGAGHKVTGLKIDSSKQLSGIFGYCYGAALSNLTIQSSYISTYAYAGLLTGMAENTTISDCHITDCHLIGNAQSDECMLGGMAGNLYRCDVSECSVESTDIEFNISTSFYTAGALLGFVRETTITDCQIMNCSVTNSIGSIECFAGGLAGQLLDGCIVNGCSVESTTIEGFYVGGLVGFGQDLTLLQCYANTSISGVSLGGLACALSGAAEHPTNVSECYSAGTINMTSPGISGGFVAWLLNDEISVSNCFSTSNISPATYQQVGGFAGFTDIRPAIMVEKCYSIGQVPGSGPSYNGFGEVGNNCYWDTVTSNTTQSQAGTGKVTAEMLQQATFNGWNFSDIWRIDEGVTYPYLKNLPKPSTTPSTITAISVIPESVSIQPGNDKQLQVMADLSDGSSVDITDEASYTSENESIATVNSTGLVSAVAIGTSVITIAYNNLQCTATVTVSELGTPENPYIITTPQQLDEIRNNMSACYKLANDIDLSSYQAGEAWVPIGLLYNLDGIEDIDDIYRVAFTGSLDGDGHKITGLKINISSESQIEYPIMGLFGICSGAEIKNLVIESPNLTIFKYGNAGALIGAAKETDITNCQIIGGTVNCPSIGGGLAGALSECNITGCSIVGTNVEGFEEAGGLVGDCKNCSLSKSYASAVVRGMISGGLTGYVGEYPGGSTISECYSTGTVNSLGIEGSCAGGLVGVLNEHGTISNCFSASSVYCNSQPGGGLIGGWYDSGSINTNPEVINSYSTGHLYGIGTSYNGFASVTNNNNCYWNIQTSGTAHSKAGSGKLNQDMVKQATFDGWNFTDIWQIDENLTYPYLKNLPKPAEVTAPILPNLVSISVSPEEIDLETGQSQQLTIMALMSDESTIDITEIASYASNHPEIASVDNKGLISIVAQGTAVITASYSGKQVSVDVNGVPVSGVSLNQTSLNLGVGATYALIATIVPDNASNQNVTWSSSDTSVAAVDANGLVTAVATGSAVITVTTEDGQKTATCAVSINNLTSGTYQYDANSKLQNIQTGSQTVTYQYDANGNLISRQFE